MRHIDPTSADQFRSVYRSGLVALMAAIGPGLAQWIYGPDPADLAAPLALGAIGGLAGFVVGVLVLRHPLRDEMDKAWSMISRKAA